LITGPIEDFVIHKFGLHRFFCCYPHEKLVFTASGTLSNRNVFGSLKAILNPFDEQMEKNVDEDSMLFDVARNVKVSSIILLITNYFLFQQLIDRATLLKSSKLFTDMPKMPELKQIGIRSAMNLAKRMREQCVGIFNMATNGCQSLLVDIKVCRLADD